MDAAPDRLAAREIISARFFPFPAARLFRAFSDPVELETWWGPRGFTNTFHVFEFRPGGAWKFTMHAPDGATYAMDKQFVEILPPERIVVRHFQQTHDFVLTMVFRVTGKGTELTWKMVFEDGAVAAKLRDFLLKANEENFDRLESHLAKPVSVQPGVVR